MGELRKVWEHLQSLKSQIEYNNEIIRDLKARTQLYIPDKNDVIDRKLAEFINDKPERYKFRDMFVRETPGIYMFGSKKIAIRYENDKIICRVGGGFLQIEEFLTVYAPIEMDKELKSNALMRQHDSHVKQNVASRGFSGRSSILVGDKGVHVPYK